jgi:hypothetical protein
LQIALNTDITLDFGAIETNATIIPNTKPIMVATTVIDNVVPKPLNIISIYFGVENSSKILFKKSII